MSEIFPCPKPSPRPRKPKTAVKKVNRKRKASEFSRCYHSKERVEFVKNLPCLLCTSWQVKQETRSENSHTETDGMGRKADYTHIIPLCLKHHSAYDRYEVTIGYTLAHPSVRESIAKEAAFVEKLWLQFSGGETSLRPAASKRGEK